jgi:hypothetical protein
MSGGWDEGSAFGELRSLTQRRASAEGFAQILGVVERAEEAAPGLYAERWADWLGANLARWAPRHRVVAFGSVAQGEELAARPWADLITGVELRTFDLTASRDDLRWLEGDMRARFPNLTHLGIADVAMRKPQLAALCESGLFDGMTSVSVARCGLRLPTFSMLMDRLERSPEITSLRFEECALGPKQLGRVCESSLLGGLRELALTHHDRHNAKDSEAQLAEVAGELTSLEVLDLTSCNAGWDASKTFADAAWPGTLERIVYAGNRLGLRGMREWVRSGRMDLLLDRERDTRLDLRGHIIRPKGLAALTESDVLGQLEELVLGACLLTHVRPLLECDALGELRTLDLGSNDLFEEGTTQDVLALLERTRPQRFGMNHTNMPEGFIEAFTASEASLGITHLTLNTWQYEMTPEDLGHLLDWPGMEGLEVCDVHLKLPLHHAIVGRVRADARFNVSELDDEALVFWRDQPGYHLSV